MTERKGILPKSIKRREPEVVYDVYPQGLNPSDDFKKEVTLKAMDSLPDLLKLAQTYMDIKRGQAEVLGQIQYLREQGDYLQKQADAFVKADISRRDTFRTKGEKIEQLLQDLYQHLSSGGTSSEVQKEVIGLVNNSIQQLLKSEGENSSGRLNSYE